MLFIDLPSIVIQVVTKREIPEGQQILIDYNEYKPEMSEKYYFLNHEDNGDSALRLYQDNQIHYELFSVSQKLSL